MPIGRPQESSHMVNTIYSDKIVPAQVKKASFEGCSDKKLPEHEFEGIKTEPPLHKRPQTKEHIHDLPPENIKQRKLYTIRGGRKQAKEQDVKNLCYNICFVAGTMLAITALALALHTLLTRSHYTHPAQVTSNTYI